MNIPVNFSRHCLKWGLSGCLMHGAVDLKETSFFQTFTMKEKSNSIGNLNLKKPVTSR